MTLGIETSGRAGSVALGTREGEIQERILSASGRRHARTLVPEIQTLLTECGIRARDLDLIGVSIGPGSFTGLRVGVVCAKTLAYVTQAAVIGIDTFLAVAAGQCMAERLWVIDDPLRGDVFAGEDALENNVWRCVREPGLRPFDEWRLSLDESAIITGPGLRTFAEDLQNFHILEETQWTPRAAMIAKLAAERFEAGEKDDPWTLEPFYMRRSAAEEKADQSN